MVVPRLGDSWVCTSTRIGEVCGDEWPRPRISSRTSRESAASWCGDEAADPNKEAVIIVCPEKVKRVRPATNRLEEGHILAE